MARRLITLSMFATLCSLQMAAGEPDDPMAGDRKRSEWIERLKHKDTAARVEAASVIGEMRWFAGAGTAALAEVLAKNANERVRTEAASALGKIADADVSVPALVKA